MFEQLEKFLDFFSENSSKIDGFYTWVLASIGSLMALIGIAPKLKSKGGKNIEPENEQVEQVALTEDILAKINANAERLDSHEKVISGMQESLQSLTNSVYELKETCSILEDIKQERYQKKKAKELANRIEKVGRAYIKTEGSRISRHFAAMIMAGTDKAATFFGSIVESGFDTADVEFLAEKALDTLRNIKNSYVQYPEFRDTSDGEIFGKKVKRILEPKLRKVFSIISQIQDGVYNGGSHDKYVSTVIEFVDSFVSESIAVYMEHQSKLKN
jgi:hypothetical protein